MRHELSPRGPSGPGRTTVTVALLLAAVCALPAGAVTYYVSSQSGDDTDDGLTPATAFATIARVHALDLQPGDAVRFFCGETWRTEPLHVVDSGAPGLPIVFSSHPAGCADPPVLSGAQPIVGWQSAGTNLYVANLDGAGNSGRFGDGVRHLFRGDGRLPLGRWPNIEGHPDGGYAEVDSGPSDVEITDAELPAGDWTGAVLRIKGIRWYLLNREVVADVGSTLTVNDPLRCYQEDLGAFVGDCSEWGYYLTDHPATLDQEGEWFYDPILNRVTLYSTGPPPADGEIEASVILPGDGIFLGAITLGRQLFEHVAWVTLENLRIERWHANGITFPENLMEDENHDLVIRGNTVVDVDEVGIRLSSWIWDPPAGNGPVGWRGGRNVLVEGNHIEGANNRGLFSYGIESSYLDNTLRDIALIPELGRQGMGCGFTGESCTENGDGLMVFWSPGTPDHTARDVEVRGNRLSDIGMNGIDVYGRNHLIENNVVDRACQSKGDCGGIRVYGRNDLATTPTHDVTVRRNIVRDTLGNVDGVHPYFETLFGFGIYVDNWVRDALVEDNTVTGSTWVGLMFQLATGTAQNNTLYDNVASDYGSETSLIGGVNDVDVLDNTMFPLGFLRETFRVSQLSALGVGNGNRFFSPYDPTSLWDETLAGDPNFDDRLTLAEWQTHSGQDAGSSAQWYQLRPGEPPRSELFVNDTDTTSVVPLGTAYLDLDQQPVSGSLTLAPYSSQILIRDDPAIFRDGFESGDVTAWSSSTP